MIVEKPTPEYLDDFLKSLTNQELTELIVTRAHQDNTVPIEFTCYSKGTRCGIDNDGYKLAMVEAGERSKRNFDELGLTPKSWGLFDPDRKIHDNSFALLELNRLAAGAVERPFSKRHHGPIGLDDMTQDNLLRELRTPVVLGSHFHATVPSQWHEEQKNGRKVSSTERFEKFVKEIPINELFELGDLIVDNPVARGLGGYHSLALGQSETVYHTDLPRIYGEIKSRFKQMGVVK